MICYQLPQSKNGLLKGLTLCKATVCAENHGTLLAYDTFIVRIISWYYK